MCIASLHLPELSRKAYQISCELRMELYFVLAGWFSQIKNKILPSADIVGLNSASSELIFFPIFSILMMVADVMIFSFWGFKLSKESLDGWAIALYKTVNRIKKRVVFFIESDLT